MNRFQIATVFGVLGAASASAGGLDRSMQRIAPLFEDGGYAEFSLGAFAPDLSGTAIGVGSGNIANAYTQLGLAYKQDVGARSSIAIIFDQPWGASIEYPAGTGYVFSTTTADFRSSALTGIYQYNFDGGLSLYGGARAQQVQAEAAIPQIAGYVGDSDTDRDWGYLVGAAYERPDIALRASLTYFSKIDHNGTVTETSVVTGTVQSDLAIETPQAINFDIQTGIATDTLLFGSVRWVNWSDFVIAPNVYTNVLTGLPLVSYNGDNYTYTLGIGRRFSETWAGTAEVLYEPPIGGFHSNLGPKDGFFGTTLGARYSRDAITVSAGVNVTWIGDAETVVSNTPFLTASFTDNTAISAGLRVGYSF